MVLHGFEAFVTIFKELHNLQTTNKLTNALFARNGPYGHRLSNMLPAVIFFFLPYRNHFALSGLTLDHGKRTLLKLQTDII